MQAGSGCQQARSHVGKPQTKGWCVMKDKVRDKAMEMAAKDKTGKTKMVKRMAAVVDSVLAKQAKSDPETFKLDMEMHNAFLEADDVPTEMWYVFHLAAHWFNDLKAWCDAIRDDKFDEMFIVNLKPDEVLLDEDYGDPRQRKQ